MTSRIKASWPRTNAILPVILVFTPRKSGDEVLISGAEFSVGFEFVIRTLCDAGPAPERISHGAISVSPSAA
jgi:hypothetical protein